MPLILNSNRQHVWSKCLKTLNTRQHRFVILEEKTRHKVDLYKDFSLPPGSREAEPKYTINLLNWGSRNQRLPFWFGGDGKPTTRSYQWEINRRAQETCLPHIFLTTELNRSVGNARKPNKIKSQGNLENLQRLPIRS